VGVDIQSACRDVIEGDIGEIPGSIQQRPGVNPHTPGRAVHQPQLRFVAVVGGNNAIVDNTLMFPGAGIPGSAGQSSANTALGASLQVQEQVTNAAGALVVRKIIVADEFGATPEIDHRDFAPLSSLHISTALSANGGPLDVGATVTFDYLIESFSQQSVPEPSSLLLVGAAIAGLDALARRRHFRQS
jgi:hypothetical protein